MKLLDKVDLNIARGEIEEALKKLKTEEASALDGMIMEFPEIGRSVCSKSLVRNLSVCLNARRV